MLKAVVEKMQETCLLKYLVRNSSWLEPASLINQPKVNKMQFSAFRGQLIFF